MNESAFASAVAVTNNTRGRLQRPLRLPRVAVRQKRRVSGVALPSGQFVRSSKTQPRQKRSPALSLSPKRPRRRHHRAVVYPARRASFPSSRGARAAARKTNAWPEGIATTRSKENTSRPGASSRKKCLHYSGKTETDNRSTSAVRKPRKIVSP